MENAAEDPIVNFLTQYVGVIFKYDIGQFDVFWLSPMMESTQAYQWSLNLSGVFWNYRVI